MGIPEPRAPNTNFWIVTSVVVIRSTSTAWRVAAVTTMAARARHWWHSHVHLTIDTFPPCRRLEFPEMLLPFLEGP